MMTQSKQFAFRDVEPLRDGDLWVLLDNKFPGDLNRNYVPAYEFNLALDAGRIKIGYLQLRIGSTSDLLLYAGHIGYGVDEPYRGHRYAARACQLILPLAREHEMREVVITCDPSNNASKRTCELIGANYIETVPLAEHTDMYKAGDRFRCRYLVHL